MNMRGTRKSPRAKSVAGGGGANVDHMIGYARASMNDPDNREQIAELARAGVNARNIFVDAASSKATIRHGWQACWKSLEKGDLLTVCSLDRLGRDLSEVLLALGALLAKDANLLVISSGLDTRSSEGRLIATSMAALASLERELNAERTTRGIRLARGRGMRLGRRSKFSNKQVLEAYRSHGVTEGARSLSVGTDRTGKPIRMSLSGFRKAVARALEAEGRDNDEDAG